jgi:hypothetical protein
VLNWLRQMKVVQDASKDSNGRPLLVAKDNVVVIDRRHTRRYLFYASLVVTIINAILILFWVFALYRVQVEVRVMKSVYESHIKERAVKDEAWRAEFDNIYKTLYSPPETIAVPTDSQRRPSAVELWQVNRDKELRARIQQLERWRLSFAAAPPKSK